MKSPSEQCDRPAVQLRFAAASCNRQPGALTTLPSHSLAAYAAHNNAFIISTDNMVVQSVIPLHSSPINTVKLLLCNDSVHLLSASSDGTVSVATLRDQTWQATSWAGHSSSCVALDAIVTGGNELTIVTVGADSHLKVWKLGNKWEAVASCEIACSSTGREVLPECIAAHAVSESTTLVALGGTDSCVQIYLYAENGISFSAPLAGHRDWIRGVSFHETESELFLATASTDGTARIWDITHTSELAATLTIPVQGGNLSFIKQALLDEHTKTVHTVTFCDNHLLTASMDCSVAVWTLSKNTTCVARFGLMGGASAHALGFFGAAFASTDPSHIIAHNFSGALHRWRLVDKSSTSYQYVADPAPTGHFASVTDIAWAPRGECLLSCSSDKTTRVFAEINGSFVEWARPQVHGHSIFAAAFSDDSGRRFVSGAEERMLRLFEAPSSFNLPGAEAEEMSAKQPMGASMPQLGLSNKPVFLEQNEGGETQADSSKVSIFGVARFEGSVPLEDDLNQHRLWPETAKLYGHGNEISCVAVDTRNHLLASACRAQNSRDAEIILWDIVTGVEVQRLSAHDLTVHQMRFTSDGSALLSVSKDRSFAIFRKASTESGFRLALHRKAAHTRLLYCGAWVVDDEIVATGGRDKYVKFFSGREDENGSGVELGKQRFDSAVTAIDSIARDDTSLMAAGFDNGNIRVFAVPSGEITFSFRFVMSFMENMRCGLRVTKVCWRPTEEAKGQSNAIVELGVASEDCSVRIYEVAVTQ